VQENVTIARKCSSTEVRQLKMQKMPTLKHILKFARALPADDRVPYAFEKRIMAQLRGSAVADLWTAWSGTMWRAAFSCLVVSALVGAAVTFSDPSRAELFASDLERTVLAPVDVDDSW
jgi:hypothetical protein